MWFISRFRIHTIRSSTHDLLIFIKQLTAPYSHPPAPKSVHLVVDTSSEFTSEILSCVVQHTTATSMVIQEPAWMTTVFYLIQYNAILKENAGTILQVLLCLNIGKHATNDNLVIVLPGKSSTAILVPVWIVSRYLIWFMSQYHYERFAATAASHGTLLLFDIVNE